MRKFPPLRPLAFAACMALTGCGGSGGGGDADVVHPTNVDVATTPETLPVVDDSIRFKEDTSLQQNLNGVWIATREEEYQENDVPQYAYKGTKRQTIFIMENNYGELMIQACGTLAEGLENGSKSLAFELEGWRFDLQKNGNTNLTGKLEVVDSSASGSGTVTLIKVKTAPANRYDLYGQLSLGTLIYSDNDAPEKTFNIQCYTDFSGTETYGRGANGESDQHNYYVLSNFFQDRVEFGSELNQSSPNYRYLLPTLNGTMSNFENDGGKDIVHFTVSGKNGPHFTFDASYPTSADASSDSFSGTAFLGL